MRPHGIALALLVLLAVGVVPVHAVERHWVGPGLFWHKDGNWDPAGVPTASDRASFDVTANSTVLLSQNATVGELLLLNSNSLITQGLGLSAVTAIFVEASSRLVIGNSTVTSGDFIHIRNNGEVQISNGVME